MIMKNLNFDENIILKIDNIDEQIGEEEIDAPNDLNKPKLKKYLSKSYLKNYINGKITLEELLNRNKCNYNYNHNLNHSSFINNNYNNNQSPNLLIKQKNSDIENTSINYYNNINNKSRNNSNYYNNNSINFNGCPKLLSNRENNSTNIITTRDIINSFEQNINNSNNNCNNTSYNNINSKSFSSIRDLKKNSYNKNNLLKKINNAEHNSINIPRVKSSYLSKSKNIFHLSSRSKSYLDSFSQKFKSDINKERPLSNTLPLTENFIRNKTKLKNKNIPLFEIQKFDKKVRNDIGELYFMIPNQKILDGIGTGNEYKIKKNTLEKNSKKSLGVSKSVEDNRNIDLSRSDLRFIKQNPKILKNKSIVHKSDHNKYGSEKLKINEKRYIFGKYDKNDEKYSKEKKIN